MDKIVLPQWLYEVLRWFLTLVLPAGMTLFSLLVGTWNWDLPVDAILTTASGLATFLGVVFGISKLSNDYNNK